MRLVQQQGRRSLRRRGFTLLEVLLVVAILIALAALAVPNLIGARETANIDLTKVQVKVLDDAFKKFFLDNNRFPSSDEGLTALVAAPNQAPNWRGPYLEDPQLADAWGNPYQYQFPGTRNVQNAGSPRPDVWSFGPDGQNNTADDIGNWPQNQ